MAGLGYALYATSETVDPFDMDSDLLPQSRRSQERGHVTSDSIGVTPPQGPLLLSSGTLSSALAQLAPLLMRVDEDGLKDITETMEHICACSSKAAAREMSPTKALVEALVQKRKVFTRLKMMNRVARRKMSLEASESATDFNALINALNDAMSNLEKESSLHLMGG